MSPRQNGHIPQDVLQDCVVSILAVSPGCPSISECCAHPRVPPHHCWTPTPQGWRRRTVSRPWACPTERRSSHAVEN